MGKLLIVRIKEKGVKGDKCYEYKNEVNLSDPNMLSIVLNDLIRIYNAPVEKALGLTKNHKKEDQYFPFLTK